MMAVNRCRISSSVASGVTVERQAIEPSGAPALTAASDKTRALSRMQRPHQSVLGKILRGFSGPLRPSRRACGLPGWTRGLDPYSLGDQAHNAFRLDVFNDGVERADPPPPARVSEIVAAFGLKRDPMS